MSIKVGMDKEDVVHECNGILLNHKKEKIVLFAETWMDLETVKQSELSQKKKNIILLIYGISKIITNELICKAKIES